MTQVAEGPPKFCPECGFNRPRSDFYARRAKNGNLYAQPLCKAHDIARFRKWRTDNHERYREVQRGGHQRMRADPERAAIDRDWHREYYRHKNGITPGRYRQVHAGPVTKDVLPAGPFAAWLRELMERDGASRNDLAARLGISDKTIRDVLNGHRSPTRDTVDRALIADDELTTLRDLYPELYSVAA